MTPAKARRKIEIELAKAQIKQANRPWWRTPEAWPALLTAVAAVLFSVYQFVTYSEELNQAKAEEAIAKHELEELQHSLNSAKLSLQTVTSGYLNSIFKPEYTTKEILIDFRRQSLNLRFSIDRGLELLRNMPRAVAAGSLLDPRNSIEMETLGFLRDQMNILHQRLQLERANTIDPASLKDLFRLADVDDMDDVLFAISEQAVEARAAYLVMEMEMAHLELLLDEYGRAHAHVVKIDTNNPLLVIRREHPGDDMVRRHRRMNPANP